MMKKLTLFLAMICVLSSAGLPGHFHGAIYIVAMYCLYRRRVRTKQDC